MNDETLIKEFISTKDDLLFNQLYKRHERLIYERCFRYIDNIEDVEDVFQNIWVIIYFHIKDFKFNSDFKTWIIRITINQCINFLKTKKDMFTLQDNDDIADEYVSSASENELESLIKEENVTVILSVLNAEEINLIKMKYLEEISYEKISKLTGLTQTALRMRISRIIHKLREMKM